jgi:hypothetical protein
VRDFLPLNMIWVATAARKGPKAAMIRKGIEICSDPLAVAGNKNTHVNVKVIE